MSRLIPILALVFTIAVFFLYIKPTYSGTIADTRLQIANYDQALDAAQRFQQKEVELTQARAQIPAESLARLDDFLPDGVDNVQLILDMDALAARSGVTLSDFKTQNNEDSGAPSTGSSQQTLGSQQSLSLSSNSPIDSLDLSFKATGSYSSFRSFLSGMEASLRPIDVTTLAITKSDTGVYTYNMVVRIYWLR